MGASCFNFNGFGSRADRYVGLISYEHSLEHSAVSNINQALCGICVLDFAQVAAGPTCGMLLGDLGAKVIKIEAPGGDIGRKLGPPWQNGESVVSMSFNRNKRSIAINLKHPEGKKIVTRMVKQVDVVLESFRPGVMDRLGIGWGALSAIRPELVFCSISAYGQTGPWRDKPGVDGLLQAVSGFMSILGFEDSPPAKAQAPIVDMTTGFLATVAVLAALRARELTGCGQQLDVSMYSSALMLQQASLASYLATGERPIKIGSAAPYAAPNEAYPTRDGWIMIAAYDDKRWKTLCEALGDRELAAHPDFNSNSKRVTNRIKLMEKITKRLAIKSTAEWQAELEGRDIICGPVASYDEVTSSEQLAHSGAIVEMVHAVAGKVRMPGFAIGDSHAQSRVRLPPPTVGQHSIEVLIEFGFSKDEIEAMIASGVVLNK